jgi:hypothetical protein
MKPFLRRAALSMVGVTITLCVSGQLALASSFVVTPPGTTNCRSGIVYNTIQKAVNAAKTAGQIIYVCPGTYAEQVQITTSLTLEGVSSNGLTAASAQGGDAPTIIPPAGGLAPNGSDIFGNSVAAQIFVASTNGPVTIKYLTVDGTGNDVAGCSAGPGALTGIYYQNTAGTINYNTVRNQYETDFADYGGCQEGLAINVESTSSSNSVTISYNSVHAYQKNGITATGAATGPGALGPVVTISDNYIVGLGANALNWPPYTTPGNTAPQWGYPAAENGIQVGFGATGTISSNTVNDNIWGDDTSSQPDNAASGILIYASKGVNVTTNYVGSAQFGIVADTDPVYGPADNTTIKSNKVTGTQLFDAIDVCSNSNTVQSNLIFGSTESGVHIDDSCGTGNTNTVTGNTISEACAGVLLGTGTGNTVTGTYYNVGTTTMTGDQCPAASPDVKSGKAVSGQRHARPSPYTPMKR